ncbi:uncharacterized protein LOC131875121 [Cryptomeria japonica]|uniref:uncharacterized protein LOC131875121 n=1 Tax=Cryptomeria japonica TaxID=3369 RepID=UPI0027D9E4EB|nr:uncharacterized protein LOC131875121 [Cryptomeria japonica]
MEKLHGSRNSVSHGFARGWSSNRVTLFGEIWQIDKDLVAEVMRLQKEGTKFYRDRKYAAEAFKNFPKLEEEKGKLDKARATNDDPLITNAHISERCKDSDSDEDQPNAPTHKKRRADSENVEMEMHYDEEEKGKDTETKMEIEKDENVGEEEEGESINFQKWVVDNITSMQSKQSDLNNKINKLIKENNIGKNDEEMETSEVEEEIEMEEWLEKDLIKGDLKYLEDVVRMMKEQAEEDKDKTNTQVARIKKHLKSFMNHNLRVLKFSSQNMNTLVGHLEKKNQDKNMVIIEDVPTSNTTHQISRKGKDGDKDESVEEGSKEKGEKKEDWALVVVVRDNVVDQGKQVATNSDDFGQGSTDLSSLSLIQALKLVALTQSKASEDLLKSHSIDKELISLAGDMLEKIMPYFQPDTSNPSSKIKDLLNVVGSHFESLEKVVDIKALNQFNAMRLK